MKYFFLFYISTLFTLSFSAESVNGPSKCAVKSGTGSYSYDPVSGKGPKKWGTIDGYEMCGNGEYQSPIDFPTKGTTYKPLTEGPNPDMTDAIFNFTAGSENWALVCANPGTCGTTAFNNTVYTLFQVHFHTPSEHTLNGKRYAMESHFVHGNANRTHFVVIATMCDTPDDSTYSSEIYSGNDMEHGKNPLISQVMKSVVDDKPQFNADLGSVVQPESGFCTVFGSLTTPLCNEVVTFLMQLNVQTISKQQVHAYHLSTGGGMHGNSRPIQPLNGRKITGYV